MLLFLMILNWLMLESQRGVALQLFDLSSDQSKMTFLQSSVVEKDAASYLIKDYGWSNQHSSSLFRIFDSVTNEIL